MNTKSLVFAGLGVAILTGVGYAGSRLILGSELTPLSAAEFIPQEAFVTAYISTDADNWQQLERAGIPPSLLQNSWKQTQQGVLADTQIDYGKDIQPW